MPPGFKSEFYRSPVSRLARATYMASGLKVAVLAGFAGLVGYRELQKLRPRGTGAEHGEVVDGWWRWFGDYVPTRVEDTSMLELMESENPVMESTMQLLSDPSTPPSMRTPMIIFLTGLGLHMLVRIRMSKVVLSLTREVLGDGRDVVHIETMTAFGSRTDTVELDDCIGANAESVTQNFRVSDVGTFVLLPVEGWKSDDHTFLKTFMFADYFRSEQGAPKDDSEHIAIDGFGPYRPAQLADPAHPVRDHVMTAIPARAAADFADGGDDHAIQRDAEGVPTALINTERLDGTPFRAHKGSIYTDFAVGESLSLAERRAMSTQDALARLEATGRAAGANTDRSASDRSWSATQGPAATGGGVGSAEAEGDAEAAEEAEARAELWEEDAEAAKEAQGAGEGGAKRPQRRRRRRRQTKGNRKGQGSDDR